MKGYLLDTNLLIALAWPQHVHHALAHAWFKRAGRRAWATCPLTQLAFVRISSNPRIIADAVSPRAAMEALTKIVSLPGHRFWPDEVEPVDAPAFQSLAFTGHRQVTDVYLLALCQGRGGRLATLDKGVAELLRDEADRARYVTVVA